MSAMREFLTMSDAYEALLDGRLMAGTVFVACSRPGCVFLVCDGSKIRLLPKEREEVLA